MNMTPQKAALYNTILFITDRPHIGATQPLRRWATYRSLLTKVPRGEGLGPVRGSSQLAANQEA